MKLPVIIVACVVCIAMGACGNRGISQRDEVDFALKELQSSSYCGEEIECKDFKLFAAYEKSLSSADKLNGVEGRWCIGFNFAYKAESGNWVDADYAYQIEKKEGELRVNGGPWDEFSLPIWCPQD